MQGLEMLLNEDAVSLGTNQFEGDEINTYSEHIIGFSLNLFSSAVYQKIFHSEFDLPLQVTMWTYILGTT